MPFKRLFEVARELNITNKDAIDFFQQKGLFLAPTSKVSQNHQKELADYELRKKAYLVKKIRRKKKETETTFNNIYETRVFFVGEPHSWDISFIENLLGPYAETIAESDYHTVMQWECEDDEVREFRLQCWYFTPETILNGMHRLFFNSNTVYVLLYDVDDKNPKQVGLWSYIISRFAPKARVILALNRNDLKPVEEIPKAPLLHGTYNIERLVYVNHNIGEGLANLQETIMQEVLKLPGTGMKPPDEAERVLAALKEKYLDKGGCYMATFRLICHSMGLDKTATENVINHLQEMGKYFYYPNKVQLWPTIILDPAWAINPLLKLLKWKKLNQKNGTLHFDDLDEIWPTHSKEDRSFLMELLKHFELCFSSTVPGYYIIPARISDDKLPDFDMNGAVCFMYRYAVLPPSVLYKFIADANIHKHIKNNHFRRNSVIITMEKAEALVVAKPESCEILVYVTGEQTRKLIRMIRGIFNDIRQSCGPLSIEEHAGCLCPVCKDRIEPGFHSLSFLEHLAGNKKDPTFKCANSMKEVSAADILAPIRKLRLLIIDANPVHREVIKDYLSDNGYDPIAVEDPEIGIKVLQDQWPDILILDHRTFRTKESLDLDLLLRFARIKPGIGLIITSETVDDHLIRTISPDLKAEFLEKPFDMDDLVKTLEKVEARLDAQMNPGFDEAQALETAARRLIIDNQLKEGVQKLGDCITLDPRRKQRLKEEFGFLFAPGSSLGDAEIKWREPDIDFKWRHRVWSILAAGNPPVVLEKEKKRESNKPTDQPVTSPKPQPTAAGTGPVIVTDNAAATSEQKGEKLEQDILRLFKYFLHLCENRGTIDTLHHARKQSRGDQGGYDLKFVYGEPQENGKRKNKILVECKNYKHTITLDTIAGKLATVVEESPDIDHWILISPRANITNRLDDLLETWEQKGRYPFKIHIWTPEYYVDQFFGLVPGIYDAYFSPADGDLHPRDWDEAKRKKILDQWKQKLEPPLQLDDTWKKYLHTPYALRLNGDPANIEALYRHGVTMGCKDETGTLLKHSLEMEVKKWLRQPIDTAPSLILLGEFGDGKTVFTYTLARKLTQEFIQSPNEGWLPIRFSLRDFSLARIEDGKTFVKNRLEDFDAGAGNWNQLKFSPYNVLVILDGFDEISKRLDPRTILRNINYLIDCFETEFSRMKILITSRKHFFENPVNTEKLKTRIGKPVFLQVAPIDRRTTLDHLETYADEMGMGAKLAQLEKCHDPIGLASKPLFLEMVKTSLKHLPETEFNEHILYETYIDDSLKRKIRFLEDDRIDTGRDRLIGNMVRILEDVALELHRSQEDVVYLSAIPGADDIKKKLWTMSEEGTPGRDDAVPQVAVRSLLKRMTPETEGVETGQWPIDFCHRSMREYFVARAVKRMLETEPVKAEGFLREYGLYYEIVHFAAAIMRGSSFDFTPVLLALIRKTAGLRGTEREKAGHLGGTGVNLLYRYSGGLPGSDWSRLVLDHADLAEADLSGKDFSFSSFRHANLDNVNFTRADFRDCDLSYVRLEETSPVQSVTVASDGGIYSGYDDGHIRYWNYDGHRPRVRTLTGAPLWREHRLTNSSGEHLTLYHAGGLVYLDGENGDEILFPVSVFDMSQEYRLLDTRPGYIMVAWERDGVKALRIVRLEDFRVIVQWPLPSFCVCRMFTDCGFALYDPAVGIQMWHPDWEADYLFKIETASDVSCLEGVSIYGCGSPFFLLAVGSREGVITVYTIDIGERRVTRKHEIRAHEKTVKDICFIDGERLASGGFDRTIKVLEILPGGGLNVVGRMRMNMQCEGMKIDGVKRDEECKKLQGFIDRLNNAD